MNVSVPDYTFQKAVCLPQCIGNGEQISWFYCLKNRSKRLEKVHVVLGNKSCDLDSLISTLAYAYFLDKVSPPDVLCLPVLNIPRRDFSYLTETRFILEELNIPESFHIFRDEINLHQLNAEGKLSLTLVNSNMLTSEDKSLESAVVKVINPDEQCDGSLELQASSSSLVVKEILQEAPELITQQLAYLLRGSILFKCMSSEANRITEQQEKVLSILEEKFPDLPPREEIISVLQETQFNPQGVSIEEVMLKDLKEISDGEIKVAVSTVFMTLEDCVLHRSLIGDLKAFLDKYGFDVLVILANCLSDEKQTKRQIAVYSENLELGNQICCELEECQNPCLELDPLECGCDQILIYHQENSLVTCDQIFLLVKEVINRRQSEMISNSRTSSTEAVAGSAPLSQGSSGIMELYGSDVEPQPSSANFIENPQELNESMQAHVDVNVDLVSPDSGLATIRSSRSSKESSVFLSDDSPVAEGAASHHSLLPGFDSYSPIPEGAIAEEQKPQSRENSDNFDLFNFDLAPVVTAPSESSSRSVDCSPADDYFLNSDSSEGQQLTVQKELDEANLLENDTANYSTDLLMTTNEEDNLAEFDDNPGEMCEKTSSLVDLGEGDSSSPEMLKSADSRIPPTPMNSLVETSPLDNGQPLFFPQDVVKKINEIDDTNYSQSRVRYGSWWDGFDLDSRNADPWSSGEQESVFQSPVLWKDCKESPSLREHIDRRASDSVFLQKQPKQMEYMRAGLWDNQFKQNNWNHENPEKNSEHSHLQTASLKETKQEPESFTDPWKVSQPTPVMSDAWYSGEGKDSQLAGDSYEAWTKFDAGDIARSSENVWNMPKLDREKKSMNIPEEWAVSKNSLSDSSEITPDNETENPPIQVSPEAWDKERHSVEEYGKSKNTISVFNNMQNSSKQTEEKPVFGDIKHRPTQFENIDTWNIYDKNIRNKVTEVVVPWEDTFLYKHSDLSSSNIGDDLVVSPPDTNYSTSDSYISPTYVEDEREKEDKDLDEETVIDKLISPNLAESNILEKANKEPVPPRNMPCESSGNTNIWNTPLNNVTQLQERNSEITSLSAYAKPFLNSEQRDDQCFSAEIHTSENNFSVSETRRITPVYNQTVNDLSPPRSELNNRETAAENVETVSSVPVEDTDTSTPTSDTGNGLDLKILDLGSEIQSKKAAKTTADADEKLDSQDSVPQLNSWSLQSEQGSEEGWDNAIVTSQEGEDEYKRTDETSGQQIISDICNKPVQEESESSCNADSEENRSTTEVPSSPEKMSSSVSLEALVTENESFSNQSNPVSQEERKDLSQSNVESSSSASEEGRNYESFDDSRPQNYNYSEMSQLLSEKIEKETTVIEDATMEVESISQSSDKSSDNSENNSSKMPGSSGTWNDSGKSGCDLATSIPLMNEPQEMLGEVKEGLHGVVTNHPGICNSELVPVKSSSELNRTHEKSFIDELKKSPSSGYVSVPDITEMSVVESSFSHEIGSGRNESFENLESANLCGEPSVMLRDSFPQSPWDSQPCEGLPSPGTSPEASEVLEMANTTSSLSKDIQIKSYLEEDNVWSDYAHSSGTSPDLSDASVNVWGDLPVASDHKSSRDMWGIKNNKNLEDTCKRNEFGNECEEGFETSTEQNKVPSSLDFWNAHVDDDTVSSLSSPDINEDSENSEACPEVIHEDSTYESKQHKVSEIGDDCAQSNATSSEANEDDLDAKSKGGEKVQVGIFDENSETIKAMEVLQEDLTTMEHNVTSEHLGHRETLQENAQMSIFSEKTGSREDSYFYQMNEDITPTVGDRASKAVDMWNMPLEADLKTDQKSTVGTFDFPDDSSEWWNSQPCEEKQLEDQYAVSSHSATNQLTKSKEDSRGSPSQDDELSETRFTNATNDGNQLPPLYCDEKENKSLVPPVDISDSQINQDTVQLKQFDPFIVDKEERGLKEPLFPTAEGNQLTPQNPFTGEEQGVPTTTVQEITVLDLPQDSEGNASLIPQEQQRDTCGRLEVHNSPPGAFTVEDLSFEMIENSSPSWSISVPQTARIPDILQDNTQESNQLFSVEPDLWTNAEHIVTLKADGENPDILSHCDQDNSSEASSSPDVCQEYETKYPSSQIGVEPADKDSKPVNAWSNMGREADTDSKCQLVMQKVETRSESGSPQGYEEGSSDESCQLNSSNTQNPPEFAALEEYSLENKLVTDPIESAEITNEILEVTSLDLKHTFHESLTPESHQGTPADTTEIATSRMHLFPLDFTLTGRIEQSVKEISALAEVGKYSDIDHTAITGDELNISEEFVGDSETGVENNIRNTSVTDVPASTCGGMNTLAAVGCEAAEEESKDKQICSPKSFLPGGDEGHESDSSNPLVDDIAKESEDAIEKDVPVFKEMLTDQSPVVCTPPSDVSSDAASETGVENSIRNTSVTDVLATTCGGMNTLAVVSSEVAEEESKDKQIFFPKSFLPGGNEGHESDSGNPLVDDIAKESEDAIEKDVPVFKEMLTDQSPVVCSPPSSVSSDTESETGVENSIGSTSVTNVPASTCGEMNTLAVVSSEAAEEESKDKQIFFPKSFLPGGDEGHESDSSNALVDDIAKESEDAIEKDVPVFKEMLTDQSPVVCTPPSDVSSDAASETGVENSIRNTSVTDVLATTCGGMNTLAVVSSEVAEEESKDKQIFFPKSFLPGGDEGHESDSSNALVDDIAKESEDAIEKDVPVFKEMLTDQSPVACSPPSNVSSDAASETGVENSIGSTSVTNVPASTCGGMNTLAAVGCEAAEEESKDKQIFFPKSFLPGGDEGHEFDSSNALVDDIAKESEDAIEKDVPVFKEMLTDQSPVVCSPPSNVSSDAEPSGSRECAKDELLLQQPFCDSVSLEKPLPLPTPSGGAEGIPMIKDSSIKDRMSDTSTECLLEDHTSVPSLSESEVTLGASEISIGKSEAEKTDLDSPPGGDKRSPDEAGTDSLLCRENKLRNAEGKEYVRMQVHQDPTSLEMDYILATEEENMPSTKDTLERNESDFAFQESNVAEQAESHEDFSPGSLDAFQPISIKNEGEDHSVAGTEWDSIHLEEKSSCVMPQKLGGEGRSQESHGQDEGWIILGQNEVSGLSPEEISAESEMAKSESEHSGEELAAVVAQESILDTQAEFQVETPLQKSFEDDGCSPSSSLTTKDEISSIAGTHVLQVVGGDGAGEANSQQRLGDNVATEQEMKEEMVLVNRERELSQKLGLVQEDVGMDIPFSEGVLSPSSTEMRPEPPNSLDLNGSHPRRIKLTAPNINLSLDQSEGSILSDDNLDTPDEIDINVDDLDTPDEADSFEYTGQEEQTATKDASQEESESIPEYTAEEEREDNRLWRTVVIGEQEQRIDMKVIEPYKKVISHGGYYGDGLNAIIVFAACFLPDSSRTDYNYVMENLFLYVISTLELMVAEDYMIVYLNGATPRRRMPGLGWMKKCYQMIDRRLRKNLKSFIIVHPSWFIRTILAVTRPFISSKFSSKIQYVNTLAELREMIPMEYVHIPDSIINIDMTLK